jgi:hypothetical protein
VWGWRLPFLFSIVLVIVGLVVRLSLVESPVFAALRREQSRSNRPIVDVFRERPRELVLAALSFVANTIGYIFRLRRGRRRRRRFRPAHRHGAADGDRCVVAGVGVHAAGGLVSLAAVLALRETRT